MRPNDRYGENIRRNTRYKKDSNFLQVRDSFYLLSVMNQCTWVYCIQRSEIKLLLFLVRTQQRIRTTAEKLLGLALFGNGPNLIPVKRLLVDVITHLPADATRTALVEKYVDEIGLTPEAVTLAQRRSRSHGLFKKGEREELFLF